MIENPKITYHLRELEIARDPGSPAYAMPVLRVQDRKVLDIGCGIGQTLLACDDPTQRDRTLVGMDVDRECLRYGREHYNHIEFVHAAAENLPFQNGAFDLVISRVTLPYTVLTASLPEIVRVLADEGWAWLTLHSFTKTLSHLQAALRKLALKEVLFQLYVLGNGTALHCFGRQFRFPRHGVCESFQTPSRMRRDLVRAGFMDVRFPAGTHFLCIAHKAPV